MLLIFYPTGLGMYFAVIVLSRLKSVPNMNSVEGLEVFPTTDAARMDKSELPKIRYSYLDHCHRPHP